MRAVVCKYIKFLHILFIMLSFVRYAHGNSALKKERRFLDAIKPNLYKIFVVSQPNDPLKPWKMERKSSSTGTGFLISPREIMTNAHVVADAKFIQVQRANSGEKIEAEVKFVAHDCDLAILTLKDGISVSGYASLDFAPMPDLLSKVYAVGFPTGGQQISITAGIVSRIDYRTYVHDAHQQHILVQVDSAINPGNSGGPVFFGDKIVGVAFQGSKSAENTGYIIPYPVISRFLEDVRKDNKYDGHIAQQIEYIPWAMQNPNFIAYHKVPKDQTGVLVESVPPVHPAFEHIQSGDFLTHIEGKPVGFDGKVLYLGERVPFNNFFDLSTSGEKIAVVFFRGGIKFTKEIPISLIRPPYYQGMLYEKEYSYEIVGGLVFTPVSRNVLEEFGGWTDIPLNLKILHRNWQQFVDADKEVKELIVVSGLLPLAMNNHADDYSFQILKSVNGQGIASMSDFREVLKRGEEFIALDFWLAAEPPLIFKRADHERSHQEIATRYDIHTPGR